MNPKPLPLLAAAVVIAAGCGSSGASDTDTAPGSTNARATGHRQLTSSEKAVKFAECMRRNGVGDFPDPTDANADSYGVSVSGAVFSRAVSACKALKPPGALDAKLTPKQQSAALTFARCVRSHGVRDFPDPVSGQPLINTEKIPSSNRPGGMTILNAATGKCGGILKKSAGGQG